MAQRINPRPADLVVQSLTSRSGNLFGRKGVLLHTTFHFDLFIVLI